MNLPAPARSARVSDPAVNALCRQGRSAMLQHKASGLGGPISKSRRCWNSAPQPARNQSTVRTELVERIRREIAEGTYETPEKLQIALERLLNRLEWE